MAYSFPLLPPDFLNKLPVRSLTIDLPEAIETSETGGGEILMADMGVRLWQGEITLGDMTPTEADEARAMIDVVRGAGRSFLLYDLARPGPRLDPKGTILGSRPVTLLAVSARREIRLAGLPPAYGLRHGDMLEFLYGSNPTRRALHKAVASATAGSAGNTDFFEVVPNLEPGWTLGAAVRLHRARCKAVIVPGSVQTGRREHTLTKGVSFQWRQTLR